jgi:hypothetical protein
MSMDEFKVAYFSQERIRVFDAWYKEHPDLVERGKRYILPAIQEHQKESIAKHKSGTAYFQFMLDRPDWWGEVHPYLYDYWMHVARVSTSDSFRVSVTVYDGQTQYVSFTFFAD